MSGGKIGAMARALRPWAALSLDAKVVGAVAGLNWLLLFERHTIVQVTGDGPLWQLFPGLWGAVWLLACGLVALAYPLRDHALGSRFLTRDRVIHLAWILFLFVVLPALAAILLRATGKPYTFVHDGVLMIEDAARKLLLGQNPYVADYLDTSLFYWPMINNPALYHLTYFPFPFLVTVPFVGAFDRLGLFWDERFIYLPAFLATLAVLPALVPAGPRAAAMRLSLVALVGLNPQLFPFVAEGKNDFFVLSFLFVGVVLLQRERWTLGTLAIAVASASKLHAAVFLPFVALYVLRRSGARSLPDAARTLVRHGWPSALLLAATFGPFLVNDFHAFYDDVVAYNAGGAAWSYPISGMGFSAILMWIGVIEYAQQDFPFWILQAMAAVPLGLLALRALWLRPTLRTLLTGYAVTLLAFLFFARYFHGNYLGFITAVATPALFLAAARAPATARAVA
ncbi:MAG: hypothetical protein ACRDGT_06905, partial [Candidatus Limnocylindria bacterium]